MTNVREELAFESVQVTQFLVRGLELLSCMALRLLCFEHTALHALSGIVHRSYGAK